jgi:hypothetical protein
MTERISSDPSRNVCRRPEDEQPEAIPRETPAPPYRDRLVSAPPIDWDKVSSSCDANAADAARNASQGGGMCGGRWPGAAVSSPGAASEPRSDASPPSKTKAPAPPPVTAGASGNAARTSERDFRKGPYAAEGYTHDGGSAFAGVAGLKGRTEEGLEGEALSVSIQAGEQNELQGTFARLGYSGAHGAGSVEALTASVHVGIDNSDGSHGVNAGAAVALASSEITLKHSGWSATGGLAAGIGAEGHVGIRDDDKDGKPELCGRVALGIGIGGACIEMPVVIRP